MYGHGTLAHHKSSSTLYIGQLFYLYILRGSGGHGPVTTRRPGGRAKRLQRPKPDITLTKPYQLISRP